MAEGTTTRRKRGETPAKTTEYVVLEWRGDSWKELERARATSTGRAIRAVLDGFGPENVPGLYVAVPARSFQPERFALEPQPPKIVSGAAAEQVSSEEGEAETLPLVAVQREAVSAA